MEEVADEARRVGEMQPVEQVVRGYSPIPQATGQQITVFCWNVKFSQHSGSELFPRPGAASPAVPSMRKTIPVFYIGQQEKLFLLINNKISRRYNL